jgi:hypothetical protein
MVAMLNVSSAEPRVTVAPVLTKLVAEIVSLSVAAEASRVARIGVVGSTVLVSVISESPLKTIFVASVEVKEAITNVPVASVVSSSTVIVNVSASAALMLANPSPAPTSSITTVTASSAPSVFRSTTKEPSAATKLAASTSTEIPVT